MKANSVGHIEKQHRGSINKSKGNGNNHLAWKSSIYSTDYSRLALCVLFELVANQYYKHSDEIHHKPDRPINWKLIRTQFFNILPNMNMYFRDGLPATKDDISTSILSGRWVNFTHKSKIRANGGYSNNFTADKTEHPLNHKELLPFVFIARQKVVSYLRSNSKVSRL